MTKPDEFLLDDRSSEKVCEAGVRIFVMLYYGRDLVSLTGLRYSKYKNMAPSSRTVKSELKSFNQIKPTNEKYRGSKRLEASRYLFGASYSV